MKLRYRGVSYESNSLMTQTIESGVTARFRGRSYQVRRPLVQSYYQPQMNLRYRGIFYSVNPKLLYSNASDFTTERSLVVDSGYIASNN